jgi:hypothetical protein
MTDNKLGGIFWAFLGVVYFAAFAFDIENDRDVWTWLWLLCSQLSFLSSLRCWIMVDRG